MMKNKNEPLISVVVPCYDVELYLENCINSILGQTFGKFEVLLINDGSTDNTGIICEEYEKKDKRVRVIHQKNKGLSGARNKGIEEAKGEYITFIDSDDTVKETYLEYLYNLMKDAKYDMSICSYSVILNENKTINLGKKYHECIMNTEEALERLLCENGFTVSACAKMFKKSLFEDVRFPENKLCEDNGTTYKLIMKCEQIAYGNESQYNYYKREGSIMNSQFNERKLDLIELTDEMCEEIEKKYPTLKNVTDKRRVHARFSILRQMTGTELSVKMSQKKEEIKNYLKENKKNIKKNPMSSKRDKIASLALSLGESVFRNTWKLYEELKKISISEKSFVLFSVFIVLLCTYIIPSGYINGPIPVDKAIFSGIVILLYVLSIVLKLHKISKKEIFFITLCLLFFVVFKYVNYLLFITILFADILLKQKESIQAYLKKSNILYICLVFTFLYSLLNFGRNDRFAYTALLEINQSGLAIFCLALLLMPKNKKIGYITLFFGFLTFSRSYILAVVLYLLSKLKLIKKVLSSKKVEKSIKHLNYFNLTIASSIILILVGIFYIIQYKNGNIVPSDDLVSKFHLLDLSNFYRFVANLLIILIFVKFPNYIISGVSPTEYILKGKEAFEAFNLPYKYVNPHNLFFSHLKMYGIFVFAEILYVSNIIKKIVTKNNLFIYFGIVLYSIILGAGLYSYWLYLSVFVLIVYEHESLSQT